MAVPRIGPRRPRRIYIAEWREARGLSQERLANRLNVTDVTVSRWETGRVEVSRPVMEAVAEALDIDVTDLYRHPDAPSADALLRDQSPEIIDQALKLIKAIRN